MCGLAVRATPWDFPENHARTRLARVLSTARQLGTGERSRAHSRSAVYCVPAVWTGEARRARVKALLLCALQQPRAAFASRHFQKLTVVSSAAAGRVSPLPPGLRCAVGRGCAARSPPPTSPHIGSKPREGPWGRSCRGVLRPAERSRVAVVPGGGDGQLAPP